jgi:hypothetical protein
LSHISSPFCFDYFGGGVLLTVCLGWSWTKILPFSAYQVSRITDVSCWCPTSCFIYSLFTYAQSNFMWYFRVPAFDFNCKVIMVRCGIFYLWHHVNFKNFHIMEHSEFSD